MKRFVKPFRIILMITAFKTINNNNNNHADSSVHVALCVCFFVFISFLKT